MKTIQQALVDEIHFPIGEGFVQNKLIARGIEFGDEFTTEVAKSPSYIGAVADCLFSLIAAPNFSEADKSFSMSEKSLLLRKVNSLYNSIGEPSVALDEKPMVYILD